jgi:hypothetical protein
MFDLKISPDEKLRREFSDRKIVVVKKFLPPELISAIHAAIPQMVFEYQRYKYDGNSEFETYEALAMHSKIYGYISQSLNNPRLLEEVMELTGEKNLIGFWGRLYRLQPDGIQRFDWHKDLDTGKRIAVSINISPKPFTGGELIFRLEGRAESEIKIHNVGEGDAVFFLIDRAYEHRVLPLSGEASKYAITGWFQTMAPKASSLIYA